MLGLKFGQTEKYTSFLDLPRYAIKLPVLTMGGISYSDCTSPQRSAQSHNYLRNVFSKRPMKKLYESFGWKLSSETNSHSKNESRKSHVQKTWQNTKYIYWILGHCLLEAWHLIRYLISTMFMLFWSCIFCCWLCFDFWWFMLFNIFKLSRLAFSGFVQQT